MTRDDYVRYGARALARRGVDLPQAKLDPAKVVAIRRNVRGWAARQWARALGVHQRTIDKVRDYRSWIHV